jgi:hypothetical protein
MSFRDELAADVTAVFLNSSEFAENITYYRRSEPGKPRTVTAVVDRGMERDEPQQYRTETRQTLVVQCASDSATGIADPQTGDAIRLAEDPPDTRHPFVELRHNAEGFSTLVFRRVELVRAGDKQRPR